jgi:hypothetical protein
MMVLRLHVIANHGWSIPLLLAKKCHDDSRHQFKSLARIFVGVRVHNVADHARQKAVH